MKKKLALLLAAGLMVTGSLYGCGSKDAGETAENTAKTEETAEGGTEKKEGDTFTVGFDANFPPYGYKDENGEYVGFDLDLAQEVCDRNGWELVKQPIDWDSKIMEIESGTVDCLWNGFTMNGLEEDYTWSEPYVDNSQVIVVAADSGIETFEDLAGRIVEVQVDSSGLKALEGERADLAATFGSLNQVPDYNTAFMDLEAGATDAVAMDIGVAEYQIESRGGGYTILEETVSSEQYGVGFKKGNTALRDQVQETLNEMVEDGTFMEIAKKWGTDGAVCLGK